MRKKGAIDDKLMDISKEIEAIKEETIWIRNKILQSWHMPYTLYTQYLNK